MRVRLAQPRLPLSSFLLPAGADLWSFPGEWWWSPLLEELQAEGSCVQADSWSLVVEPDYLQTLHKDLIKQQDVIYGTWRRFLVLELRMTFCC